MPVYAYFYESRALRAVHFEVTSEDLPAGFDGFKILYISDIHHGCRGSFNLIPKIIEITRQESPDIIFFGGDYSEDYTREMQKECFEALRPLSAPYGKYGVLGNHDYLPCPLLTIHQMETFGKITSLNDTGVWIQKGQDRIRVFGTEYLWDQNAPLAFPRYEVSFLKKSDFVIFLPHSPDHFERFTAKEKQKLDLVLAGHSHGGQITFFGLWAPVSVIHHKEYMTGCTKKDFGTTVITSNGVGTNVFPFRFFAPPQILCVTLKCGK
ncbi:MAG: metallophosphoesterase [Planctomycetia bacterium]|nr:metallophosphoesterase [Planctomycetia bacterium]